MNLSPEFFASVLRALMVKQGLKTQREVADLLDVTSSQVSRWLSPRDRRDVPGDEMLPKIAELSGHDVEKLILYKKSLKWQEEGVDLSTIGQVALSLSVDQETVLDLMDQGDYLAAAQLLLQRSRLSA